MAFKPPKNFDFHTPQGWTTWKRAYLRFHESNELEKKSESVQVSQLVYAMGPDADRILDTFTMTDADKKKFLPVLAKFDEYFTPARNIIHERAQFHKCSQKEGETVDEYVRRLYEAAEFAEFPDKENTIRDRLVLGLTDTEISEKLQIEDELTLVKAIRIAKRDEAVKKQLKEQRHVDAVFTKGHGGGNRGGRGGHKGGRGSDRQHTSTQENEGQCQYCGYNHPPRRCKAYGETCRKCKRKNHFARMCGKQARPGQARQRHHQPKVDYVSEDDYEGIGEVTEVHLMAVSNSKGNAAWREELLIDDIPVTFKIDTGADVSCMSYTSFKKLRKQSPLIATDTVLKSPGGVLDCAGKITLNAKVKGSSYPLTVYVIKANLADNLLSRGDSLSLNLVKRIDDIYGEIDRPMKTDRPAKIELKPDHEPYSLKVARRIPIPLLGKVEEKLKEMEKTGIIEKIEEPTDWCAPIVPVLKPNGEVRITTDFKKLNQAVKRERYLLPTVEELLHKLRGSKVFSKLDARSGFFQVPLDNESAKLTAFITPCGRYYYKRLPQGISSAPEIFQMQMEAILGDQENVEVFMDDILIHSKTDEDYVHLSAALKKLNESNVKLNQGKCELHKILGACDKQGRSEARAR